MRSERTRAASRRAVAASRSDGRRPPQAQRLARTALVGGFVLVILLVVVSLVQGLRTIDPPTSAASTPTASSTAVAPTTPAPSVSHDPNYEGAAGSVGPTSRAVPQQGAGTFTVLDAPTPPAGGQGRVVTFDLEVENGVDIDRTLFVNTVRNVLYDPRGWQTQDHVQFVPLSARDVAAGKIAEVRVTLATPKTVDILCAPLQTQGKVSCSNNGRAVLNLLRWLNGAEAYGTDVPRYRIYQINHEVGHTIGHGHAPCPGPGRPAPVMLQQTLSLQGCSPNTWPTVTQG